MIDPLNALELLKRSFDITTTKTLVLLISFIANFPTRPVRCDTSTEQARLVEMLDSTTLFSKKINSRY